MRRLLLLALVLGGALSAQPRRVSFQKGVNFTAERPDTYQSPAARQRLVNLRQYGVDAVALVPYGFTPRDQPIVRFGGRNIWETDEAIESLSAAARQAGMKVLLKPQIWVGRGFPGDLDFSTPLARGSWFSQYERFVEHYARLAARTHADLFCVGVEFVKLSTDETAWRRMIARARELYSGPLVYAATQGVEFESVRFWDALDYIGLNNYYPLPDDLSTKSVVAKVAAVQQRYNRPVIFPEAGFASLEAPHRAPWDETPRRLSMDDQARSYEAIFRGFYRQPWFHGMYWWKIGSNGYGGPQDGSHTPWGKPAMDVVKRWYQQRRL